MKVILNGEHIFYPALSRKAIQLKIKSHLKFFTLLSLPKYSNLVSDIKENNFENYIEFKLSHMSNKIWFREQIVILFSDRNYYFYISNSIYVLLLRPFEI